MTSRQAFVLLFLSVLFQDCRIFVPEPGRIPGYDLSSPDERMILPPVLFEISAITLSDSSKVKCVQDEAGVIFEYDYVRREITGETDFWGPGDYEGIASVNDTVYVLRSDGFLFEVTATNQARPDVTPYPTGIPLSDNEGLCYDRENNRLLITCKEYTGKGSKSKRRRNIFAFDLREKRLSSEPVYSFRLDNILEVAFDQNPSLQRDKGGKGSKDKEIIRFQPSDIAINPLNGKLFILSGVDHAIAIFSKEGVIENFAVLNHALFNQPEGILFLRNGDILISNEGGNAQPTLLRFNHRDE